MVRSIRSVRGLAALFALLLICGPRRDSRADDDADKRRDLMSQVEQKVSALVDALEEIPGDSGEGWIDRARALAYEVKALAERLRDVAGDDSDAKRIADRYPADMDELVGEGLPALRALKQGQHHADPEAQMCAERDKELARQASEFDGKNDPDGLTELPKLAAQYQEASKQAIEQARRDDDKLEDAEDEADDYSADGGLRDVDGTVAADARRMYADGHKSEEAAEKACENLLRGVEHPMVREVLARLGNSAGGRKAIIEELTKQVAALGSALAAVPGDPGTSAVERANTALTEIQRGLETLGRTPTNDKDARRILEKWPAIVTAARASMAGVAELNQFQHVLDPLPDRCKEKERELDEFIAHNGDDSDGLETIPSYAAGVADPIDKGLVTAKARLDKQAAAQQLAKQFRSDEGPWAAIEGATAAAATTMYNYFEDKEEETVAACQELRKGENHPKVKSALDRLRAHSGSAIDVLTRDVNEWVMKSKATYRLDCDAMQALWSAYCEVDYEEGESAETDPAERIASEKQSQMRAAMEPLLAQLDELRKRTAALARKKETKDRANALSRDIDKEAERLTRLYPSGTWRGVNDPLKFYAAEFGKSAHRRKTSEFRCDVHDVTFEGGGRSRPDCVRASDCKIWEFKPKGAEAEGEAQLREYRKFVNDYYQGLVDRDENPDSDHGGASFMQALRDRGCIRDKRVTLDTQVEPYEMCEKKYWCVEN